MSWTASIVEQPGHAVAAAAALAVVTLGAGLLLRSIDRRSRSLRRQLLATTLAALAVAATAAVGLSWLMVLDGEQLVSVLGTIGLTAVSAVGLVVVASTRLGRDAAELERTVRRVEQGDRAVRTGIDRKDELGHVAHALDQLTERLGVLEDERAQFESERSAMLSAVSHDLRTPIAALQAAVEALTDGLAPDPDRYLRSMRRDIDALGSLVEDLFLVVRLDSGRYDMPSSSVDLTEVADEAIEALGPMAAERAVDLRLEAPGGMRVHGNERALGRVVRNLLDNAIRHAPDGSTVTVVVDPTSRSVRVIDEGPGFPDQFAAKAFEHFTRADSSRNRVTGGAGLGLAIARGVVEAHGGQIWIEGAPGGRVAFELPELAVR